MEVLKEIGLEFVEISTFVCGMIGICIFSLPFISQDLMLKVNQLFNRSYDIDTPINKTLNRLVQTDSFTYRYRIGLGIFLFAGSIFFLTFLFSHSHADLTQKVATLGKHYRVLGQICLVSITFFSKISALAGILAGICLIFFPQKLRQWETRLNHWFSTEPLEDRWSDTNKDIDAIFFLHPILLGSAGMCISLILTVLAVLNLLD